MPQGGVMAHTKITIDNKVILDANLDNWQAALPDQLTQHLRPGANPQPWMKALLIAMSEAAATNQPLTANIHTRPGGWTLDVSTAVILTP